MNRKGSENGKEDLVDYAKKMLFNLSPVSPGKSGGNPLRNKRITGDQASIRSLSGRSMANDNELFGCDRVFALIAFSFGIARWMSPGAGSEEPPTIAANAPALVVRREYKASTIGARYVQAIPPVVKMIRCWRKRGGCRAATVTMMPTTAVVP